MTVALADPLRRITDAEMETAINTHSPGTPREAARNAWRPPTWPPYSRFTIGADGLLWVADRTPDAGRALVWTAFDVNGRLIGRLEVPSTVGGLRTSVISFGANEVQLRGVDDDGFVHLLFYKLERVAR